MSDGGAQIFISYKTGRESGITFQARTIADKLGEPGSGGHTVWMDATDMQAGLDWNTQIYQRIPRSDIVLLMLCAETSESDWVRREIDVAKGAQVTILPVMIRSDFELQDTLDKLDIPRMQAVTLLTGSDQEYKDLINAIEMRKEETRGRQLEWLHDLREVEEPPRHPMTPTQSRVGLYGLGETPSTVIHLAGGDITDLRDIDVYVNSENDYMQMGRVFDRTTVSSTLRYLGACFDSANRLLEDTVQNELNLLVEGPFGPRPLGHYAVLVTSAGHADSELREINRARYIFHAATVSVQGDGLSKRLEAISTESGIHRVVRELLTKVDEVNDLKGVVSPEGTFQREQQESARDDYEPIRSIAIPLFGTGRGGLSVEVVAPALARAIHEFLIDDSTTTLERIYVVGFYETDVEALKAALGTEFEAVEEA